MLLIFCKLNTHLFIMAGTYSQLYIQVVFAVKGRANVIQSDWKDGLYSYI